VNGPFNGKFSTAIIAAAVKGSEITLLTAQSPAVKKIFVNGL